MDKVIGKINSMEPAELSKLFCDALDESGIKYEIGKCNINFNGLSVDDGRKENRNEKP